MVYFKTNGKQIHEYPHISNYVKEIYQMPGGLLMYMLSVAGHMVVVDLPLT